MDAHTQHYARPYRSVPLLPQLPVRQFEFGPTPATADYAAVGTPFGCAAVLRLTDPWPIGAVRFGAAHKRNDSVLALCWLRRHPFRFAAGSDNGVVTLIDARGAVADDQREGEDGDGAAAGCTGGAGGRLRPGSFVPEMPLVHRYPMHPRLTSVHVNCDDTHLLASGYTFDVPIYDTDTGKVVRTLVNAHAQHINIARFAHGSPWLLATSSFDQTVKVWDMRVGRLTSGSQRPLYTVASSRSIVTISFSPDDQYLLTSAVDNELRQYVVADGTFFNQMDAQELGRPDNYTRAYYADGGAAVISGASEESVLRVHSAATGEPVHTIGLVDGWSSQTLYCQSLRGHPLRRGFYGVLTNYREPLAHHSMRIIDVLADEKAAAAEAAR